MIVVSKIFLIGSTL
ncbi:unnamed protein product [Rhodiola kirilowii]